MASKHKRRMYLKKKYRMKCTKNGNIKCPFCDGEGGGSSSTEEGIEFFECDHCEMTGYVNVTYHKLFLRRLNKQCKREELFWDKILEAERENNESN